MRPQRLDGEIEIEQQRALLVAGDQALHPEHRRQPRAARHRRDAVQAGRGIEDHVAGRQLDRPVAGHVLDHQLAAVIAVGIGEEEGGGKIGADAPAGRQRPPGIVDMGAEIVAGLVAAEHRRVDRLGQSGGLEEQAAGERLDQRVVRARAPFRSARAAAGSAWRARTGSRR